MKEENCQVERITKEMMDWIRNYFEIQGPHVKAVVGISGGKDSSVVATLCTRALGKERVVGVLMPNGEQTDIQYSYDLCTYLGIPYTVVDISPMVNTAKDVLLKGVEGLGYDELHTVTTFNTPARIRMTILYGISGTVGGRVANTCNLSEDWVGYATKFGDGAGDFSPLMYLTVQEVKAIARVLGLPEKFVEKTPLDGLCGQTDEENLGFTYQVLDRYIREGICEDKEIKHKIDTMHQLNQHKLQSMPAYKPTISFDKMPDCAYNKFI